MPDWHKVARRVASGEDIQAVLDEADAADRADFDRYLREELKRPDLADRHAAKMREIDLGIYGARQTWAALSAAQRRVLADVAASGSRVWRDPNNPNRFYFRLPTLSAVARAGVRTIRNLAARELAAWDGGAFDPEAAAVITERGRFVAKIGREAPADE